MDKETVQCLMNVIVTPNMAAKSATIRLQYPTIYRTSCIMNVQDFPFDRQTCTLTFGSWTHDNLAIDSHPLQNNVPFEYCIPNQQWDIRSFYSEKVINQYDCCPNPYTIVIYRITLQRKPLFYTINLIIPSAIVTLINDIGLFTITSSNGERGEKVSLGLSTLLALSLLLLQISDFTPQSSTTVSVLGRFVLSLIFQVGAGIVMTVIVIHLQYKSRCGHPSTRWLRIFLTAVGWIAASSKLCGHPKHVAKDIRNKRHGYAKKHRCRVPRNRIGTVEVKNQLDKKLVTKHSVSTIVGLSTGCLTQKTELYFRDPNSPIKELQGNCAGSVKRDASVYCRYHEGSNLSDCREVSMPLPSAVCFSSSDDTCQPTTSFHGNKGVNGKIGPDPTLNILKLHPDCVTLTDAEINRYKLNGSAGKSQLEINSYGNAVACKAAAKHFRKKQAKPTMGNQSYLEPMQGNANQYLKATQSPEQRHTAVWDLTWQTIRELQVVSDRCATFSAIAAEQYEHAVKPRQHSAESCCHDDKVDSHIQPHKYYRCPNMKESPYSQTSETWESERECGQKSDWFVAATALERICLVTFCSLTILITSFILIDGYQKVNQE